MSGLDEFDPTRTHNPHPDRYGREWVVRLPWTGVPLSANDRLHWRVEAKIKAEIRAEAFVGALKIRPKGTVWPLDRAEIVLVYVPRDKRRRDRMNLAPTLKAAVDGLVQAEVVVDDDDTHVHDDIRILPPDGDPRLELTIREVLAP